LEALKKKYKIHGQVFKYLTKFEWKDEKDVRAVIAGAVCDLYVYEKPIESKPWPEGGRDKTANKENKEKNRLKVLRKAREAVISYANANINENTAFVSLTFANNEQNIAYANNEVNKFIKRLAAMANGRKGKQSIPYVAVIEFQTRGAIHYHFLIFNFYEIPEFEFMPRVRAWHATREELEIIREKEKYLASIWRHGFVDIDYVQSEINNVGAYLIKYMVEDIQDSRLQGKKSYFHSRDLKKPVILYSKAKIESIAETWTLVKSSSYVTKANGTCWHHVMNREWKAPARLERNRRGEREERTEGGSQIQGQGEILRNTANDEARNNKKVMGV